MVRQTVRRTRRRARPRHPLDGCVEPVPPLRDSLDILALLRRLSENSPQGRNVPRKAALFNERLRPDLLQQVVLLQDAAGLLGEREQCVENLRAEGNWSTARQKHSLSHVDAVHVKFQQILWVLRHGGIRILSEFYQDFGKTRARAPRQ